jgi:hypothetical protein
VTGVDLKAEKLVEMFQTTGEKVRLMVEDAVIMSKCVIYGNIILSAGSKGKLF